MKSWLILLTSSVLTKETVNIVEQRSSGVRSVYENNRKEDFLFESLKNVADRGLTRPY